MGDGAAAVIEGRSTHHVACERAESFIDRLPDGCVSLMTLDFPYYGVKDDAWDNAWSSPEAFIAWMGGILAPCRRVLAPNGSIYVFASPEMAWKVEGAVREYFVMLNAITWHKQEHTAALKYGAENFREYVKKSERVLFAAPHSGVPAMIEAARIAASMSRQDVSERVVGSRSGACWNWESGLSFPAEENWVALRRVLPSLPEYSVVARPFSVSEAVQHTDVWTYETVNTYPGKHPCEKPPRMARDIVRASSRDGGLVADFFCGSGAFLAAAVAEGRRAIGCDMDPHWAEQARGRCDAVKATGRVVRTAPKPKDDRQGRLW